MVISVALVTVSLVISADPVDSPKEDAPSRSLSPVVVRIGPTKFSAKRLQLETAGEDGRQYRCTLVGNARLSMFNEDVKVTADKIRLVFGGSQPESVLCMGGCRFRHQDDGFSVSSDKLILDENGLKATGNVTVKHNADNSTLIGESITIRNGQIEVQGGENSRSITVPLK